MQIGLLTGAFGGGKNFEQIATWAAKAGFQALEVASGPRGHIIPQDVAKDDGRAVKRVLKETGLRISSFAFYEGFNRGDGPEAYGKRMTEIIRAAEILGVDTVCTFAGFASPGKSKAQTLRDEAPRVFEPLAKEAAPRGVRIAFENWFETNLQHLDHVAAAMQALPQPNVGFNFDPSHLHWQGIDVVAAVHEFGSRIFHTHAKDVTINQQKLKRLGINEWYNTWQYSIPGYGDVPWGEYLRALRQAKYDGVLSIEHEDGAFGVEEGFERGLRFLRTL
jgi:sugar phosphate isomerase/epimerase